MSLGKAFTELTSEAALEIHVTLSDPVIELGTAEHEMRFYFEGWSHYYETIWFTGQTPGTRVHVA